MIAAKDSTAKLLETAVLKYITRRFDESDWIDLGIETGTLELIQNHDRLLRSLSFGDEDYSTHAVTVGQRILKALSDGSPLTFENVSPAFPGLAEWLKNNDRPKYDKLFADPHPEPAWTANGKKEAWKPGINAPTPPVPASSDTPVRISDQHEVATSTGTLDPQGEIFIVHGHDHVLRNELYIFLQDVTGKKPVILDFQASGGKTLIEKFESKALKASLAVVILTPDDFGAANGTSGVQQRARQNVIFEMGYFVGSLKRSRVITINAGVEKPSDLAGLVYIPTEGNWYEKLRRELVEAGVSLVS